jgi:ATP:cob(I)alamin adenosyltransferase
VYTRTGDKGASSLFNGVRAPKTSLVFAALGDTDELNAAIGVVREHCVGSTDEGVLRLSARLSVLQSRLLDAGSCIATPAESSTPEQLRRTEFPSGVAEELEAWIDEMDDELPPLRNFILPVRSHFSASAHYRVSRSQHGAAVMTRGSCSRTVGASIDTIAIVGVSVWRHRVCKPARRPDSVSPSRAKHRCAGGICARSCGDILQQVCCCALEVAWLRH